MLAPRSIPVLGHNHLTAIVWLLETCERDMRRLAFRYLSSLFGLGVALIAKAAAAATANGKSCSFFISRSSGGGSSSSSRLRFRLAVCCAGN